jgi:hypothetical protein
VEYYSEECSLQFTLAAVAAAAAVLQQFARNTTAFEALDCGNCVITVLNDVASVRYVSHTILPCTTLLTFRVTARVAPGN